MRVPSLPGAQPEAVTAGGLMITGGAAEALAAAMGAQGHEAPGAGPVDGDQATEQSALALAQGTHASHGSGAGGSRDQSRPGQPVSSPASNSLAAAANAPNGTDADGLWDPEPQRPANSGEAALRLPTGRPQPTGGSDGSAAPPGQSSADHRIGGGGGGPGETSAGGAVLGGGSTPGSGPGPEEGSRGVPWRHFSSLLEENSRLVRMLQTEREKERGSKEEGREQEEEREGHGAPIGTTKRTNGAAPVDSSNQGRGMNRQGGGGEDEGREAEAEAGAGVNSQGDGSIGKVGDGIDGQAGLRVDAVSPAAGSTTQNAVAGVGTGTGTGASASAGASASDGAGSDSEGAADEGQDL